MNRIEQAAVPNPAQRPQPRLPRALAEVRRRAAHALLQPREDSARTRRGSTRLAVAIAALAVPMLPSSAFGVASATGAGAGPVKAAAPHARHHLHRGLVTPEPGTMAGQGTMTVHEWEASGWALTLPDRPADMGLLGHVLAMRHHGHDVPWLAEPARATHAPVPDVPANGRRPVIAAFRVSPTSPGADEPGVPASQASVKHRHGPLDAANHRAADSAPLGAPNHRPASLAPLGDSSTDRFRAGAARVPVPGRAVRSLTLPDEQALPSPLVPAARPANTKQMLSAGRQPADVPGGTASPPLSSPHEAVAAADSAAFACPRAPYPASTDRHMLAQLHPATDAMGVVVTHRRPACAVAVDYLSQARA